jgi:hypothetical protein
LCAAGVLDLEHQQALDQRRSLGARPPRGEHRPHGPGGLEPPCMRQRPLGMAGALQGQPVVRAFAPQRGASLGLPRGLPLRSGPSRPVGGRPARFGATGGCRGNGAGGPMVAAEGWERVAVIWVICGPGTIVVS